MINLIRTDSLNPAFKELVKLLDAELAIVDGEDNFFYSQFNKIDKIRFVVIAYENEQPAGCGAIKEFGTDAMEIKRMYVLPGSRKKGIALKILNELENWTVELSCTKCVLETGIRQPEAIGLYKKNGYKMIPNYGQYADVENSVCFEKELNITGSIATTIAPWLTVRDSVRAVAFYKSAFNAIELYRMEGQNGDLVARLSIEGAEFWVSNEASENPDPESVGGGSIRMILTVPDPDTLFGQALNAGASQVFAVGEEHGWRLGRLVDPFGLHWEIGRQLRTDENQ